ncbi:MAG: hypothetical protein LBV12_06470 [Puniceicoccales bacterium]|jgi:hypothetical protein|nr:hypothetical protein [Puniceicoccales bacterium]
MKNHFSVRFIKISILSLFALIALPCVALAQADDKPQQKVFEVSKVGRPGASESREKLLELFQEIQGREYLDAKGNVVTIKTIWGAQCITAEKVIQKNSDTEFIVEQYKRDYSGKVWGAPTVIALQTLSPKKWNVGDTPGEKLLVKVDPKSKTITTPAGERQSAYSMAETTPEKLGLTVISQEKFVEMLKAGRVWEVRESKVGLDKKTRITVWTVKW